MSLCIWQYFIDPCINLTPEFISNISPITLHVHLLTLFIRQHKDNIQWERMTITATNTILSMIQHFINSSLQSIKSHAVYKKIWTVKPVSKLGWRVTGSSVFCIRQMLVDFCLPICKKVYFGTLKCRRQVCGTLKCRRLVCGYSFHLQGLHKQAWGELRQHMFYRCYVDPS